jgi:hypothetical protein
MRSPYLCFFPYLPLSRTCQFGPWQVGPLGDYKGSWESAEFERMSRDFIASFRDSNGQPLRSIALLSHGSRGVDGRLPRAPQRLAIQRAIEFATLDQNPKPSDPNAGLGSATSDNAELMIWPVDIKSGRVTLSRGSMVSVMSGGNRINHRNFAVPSPLEVNIPWSSVTLDRELLAALYHLFTRRLRGDDDALRKRIMTSIGWLSQAWRNTPSIRPEDRIVMLKTGFEALCGTSSTPRCAEHLRNIYEATLAGATVRDTEDILWSPVERDRFSREYHGRTYGITDLQHWFMEFGDARNKVIHDGLTPRLNYRVSKSAYNGHLVHTAERLLRDTIKVSMAHFGYPNMWRSMLWRAIDREMARHISSGRA